MPENAKQTPPDSFQANMDTAEPMGASAAASAGRKSVLAASGAPRLAVTSCVGAPGTAQAVPTGARAACAPLVAVPHACVGAGAAVCSKSSRFRRGGPPTERFGAAWRGRPPVWPFPGLRARVSLLARVDARRTGTPDARAAGQLRPGRTRRDVRPRPTKKFLRAEAGTGHGRALVLQTVAHLAETMLALVSTPVYTL